MKVRASVKKICRKLQSDSPQRRGSRYLHGSKTQATAGLILRFAKNYAKKLLL